MTAPELDSLLKLLARLPGFGPRSARRFLLALIKKRDALMRPLGQALLDVADRITACHICGNLDAQDPCGVCADETRDAGLICVVEEVADLWALERAGVFRGRYHVLGGRLSALEGLGPQDLNIDALIGRAERAREIILALNATVEGQATAHYITERLAHLPVTVTRLAHGLPIGGELDYLDEGTLGAAFKARRPLA